MARVLEKRALEVIMQTIRENSSMTPEERS
jgi:hypothetical protein